MKSQNDPNTRIMWRIKDARAYTSSGRGSPSRKRMRKVSTLDSSKTRPCATVVTHSWLICARAITSEQGRDARPGSPPQNHALATLDRMSKELTRVMVRVKKEDAKSSKDDKRCLEDAKSSKDDKRCLEDAKSSKDDKRCLC